MYSWALQTRDSLLFIYYRRQKSKQKAWILMCKQQKEIIVLKFLNSITLMQNFLQLTHDLQSSQHCHIKLLLPMSFLCPLSARILQRQSKLLANNQILNHDSVRHTEKLQSIHDGSDINKQIPVATHKRSCHRVRTRSSNTAFIDDCGALHLYNKIFYTKCKREQI